MNPPAQVYACENCTIRQKAEAKPTSLLVRIWRWHTKFCPGWKAYLTWPVMVPKPKAAKPELLDSFN